MIFATKCCFLGTGTSHGVPVIGCGCAGVPPARTRRTSRTRCSVVLGLPGGNLLIDTPPDLRTQLLREQIGVVHAVLYTHEHADHLFGLDDLRIFASYLGHDLPVFCDQHVEERIRKVFDYAFDPAMQKYPAGGMPRLVLHADRPPSRSRSWASRSRRFRCGTAGTRCWVSASATWPTAPTPTAFRRRACELLGGLDLLVLDCLRLPAAPDAFQPGGGDRCGPAAGPAADALHAYLPRPGARGDQCRLPPGMEAGLRRPAGAAYLIPGAGWIAPRTPSDSG